jgi:hypothetical protein
MSRTEPGLDWSTRHARADSLAALRGMKIGPLFPADPDHRPGIEGTRRENRGGKDTKTPYRGASRRRRKAPVTARCLSCTWSAKGTSWRPVRRSLREHVGKKHPKLAAAS